MTVLVDLDTPPKPPIEELEKVLELKPLPNPLPNPFEKKSSSSKLEENPNPPKPPPFLRFLPKKLPKKSASSLLSNPKSLKKCLKMSSALWKLKLVPWLGSLNPYLS